MRFGIVLPHFRHVAGATAIRDVAQAAERLGFDSVWVTDRAAIPPGAVYDRFGPSFFDPFITLGNVAAQTSRVRLGITVLVLPFRHPLLAARAIASLDQLSDGRLDVGVGAGWMAEEFATLGIPFGQRGRLTDEYLDAMIALWRAPVASFKGPTIAFDQLASAPLPLQRPHPPLWVGGGSAAALRRTVKYGAAWHGRPSPLSDLLPVVEQLHTEALRQGRDPATIVLTTRAPLRFLPPRHGSPPGTNGTPDQPIGAPDEVSAAIHRYAAAGFSELVFDTFYDCPGLEDATPASILRTLDLFARAVLPAFRHE